MATRPGQPEPERAEVIEELLDATDAALDRVKVLYEQYFLGIQKQPPAHPHTDLERKLRELTRLQIRNTALRYRLATLQQKLGAYNGYWRRTLRQIESGTYPRDLHKLGRHATRTGAAVPEEILAAMPRRMREQVLRDRGAVLALARLRDREAQGGGDDDEILALGDDDVEILGGDDVDATAFIRESTEVRRSVVRAAGVHQIDEADAELDVDALFATALREGDLPPEPPPSAARPDPPRPATRTPPQETRPPGVAPGAAARALSTGEIAAGPSPQTPSSSPPPGAPPLAPSSRPSPPPERARATRRSPPRAASPPPAQSERGAARPGQALPPGMTAAEVDALYARYVQAKQGLGEELEPGAYDKLLRTLHIRAPEIMEQYKAKGVDFSVAVKDNQVILRATPKP